MKQIYEKPCMEIWIFPKEDQILASGLVTSVEGLGDIMNWSDWIE
jgi:hypothetical protein